MGDFSYKKRIYIEEKESYDSRWPQEEFIVPVLKKEILTNIDTFLKPNNSISIKRILDIGCGKQPFRNVFESKGYKYYSLDVQTQKDRHIDFIYPIDQILPDTVITDGKYNFILCTEVLEHVADWNTAFLNICNLLDEDGIVLITCPHFYQLHEEPYDFWRPTNHALEIFANNYKLKVLKINKAGDSWDVLGTLLATTSFFVKSKNLRERIIYRIFTECLQWLKTRLKNRELQKIIGVDSPIYISNIAVFQK